MNRFTTPQAGSACDQAFARICGTRPGEGAGGQSAAEVQRPARVAAARAA